MAKNLKRLVVWMLTICMLIGVMAIPAMAEDGDTPKMYFERGTASNISYMLISKSTGDVEFVKKIDIGKETSVPIITKDGYISAMFIKQSTSGMFWFSEEIEDQYIIDKTIECLKDNNPSYKGHDAIAFGEGPHDLQYKKNKVVTYIFDSIEVEEEPEVPVEPEETQPEETQPEETQPEATEPVTPDIPVVDAPEMPENTETGTATAEKKAEYNAEADNYTVSIQVPGEDGVEIHDEVIVMVDGSYSGDDEWPEMKAAIIAIGETVLNGSGNTQLTLMTFGVAPNVVVEHATSVEELAAKLPALPGGLLYGRSATNCDGSFEGIQEYIRKHDDSLNDTFVIYLSDGGANTNNTPVDWLPLAENIRANYALACMQDEFTNVVLGNAVISDSSKTIYGEQLEVMLANWKVVIDQEAVLAALEDQMAALDPESEEYAAVKAEFDAALAASNEAAAYVQGIWTATNENGKTNAQLWVAQVVKDFYAYSGMDVTQPYPVSVAETAYVTYDKVNNFHLFNTFYYVMTTSNIMTDTIGGVKGYYAAEEAARTSAMEEISTMYMVRYGYDHRSNWMTEVPGAEFIQSDSISTLCTALEGALTDLAKTPFNDVVVTDYMSKWVNLEPASLRIVDNSTNAVIWSAVDGWLIDENRPTAQEVPVVISEVDPSEYVLGGPEVEGNESGKIYKLTWYVKDGAMVRSDTYSLQYEVTADTAEAGFKYNENLPANGNTDLFYKDEDGNDMTNEITVPTVKVEKEIPAVKDYVVTFESGSASHICFLYVNRENGEIVYESKYDFDDNDTSATIPGKEGYISVVFIKQAQSGILWTSEEVDADTEAALIASVEANDPAYKGCDAVAFGEGSHDLTYTNNGKKYHTVTYNFA